MPDIKEKLVEIMRKKPFEFTEGSARYVADHLIANGVTIQQWISVEKRLPNAMDWVLCAHADGFIEVLRYDHIMDDWDTTVNNRCRSRESVTHWMPLPEPPKGD